MFKDKFSVETALNIGHLAEDVVAGSFAEMRSLGGQKSADPFPAGIVGVAAEQAEIRR
ncbi:hypothetical protein [Pseudomonas amygdali]|uniref:hypothetical protein n=1 Tax=Pseudomonas amygdali TaxID=47877 RepID=UPI0018F80945|nr:hypothetical protein [Pseudomonas amygdali]